MTLVYPGVPLLLKELNVWFACWAMMFEFTPIDAFDFPTICPFFESSFKSESFSENGSLGSCKADAVAEPAAKVIVNPSAAKVTTRTALSLSATQASPNRTLR
jgi:hypothetical protein